MQPIYTLPESLQAFQTALAFPDVFRPRAQESHKGTYGTLAIIGGATGMSGAVVLAATAAMYQGCGKVWAGFNQATLPFAIIPERPEIMLATAIQLMERDDVERTRNRLRLWLDGIIRAAAAPNPVYHTMTSLYCSMQML